MQPPSNTPFKYCMWGGNHKILEIHEKGLRKALPEGGRNHRIHRTHRKRTACREETTKYSKYTKRRYAQDCQRGSAGAVQPHPYPSCRRVRCHPASPALLLPLSREHQKSIRRMRSVQDSPPLHSGRGLRYRQTPYSTNPQGRRPGYMRPSTKCWEIYRCAAS